MEESAKVVSLHGVILDKVSQADVVELAEVILADAKSGKIQALAVIALDNEGGSMSRVKGQMRLGEMFGAIGLLQLRFFEVNLRGKG